MRSRERAAVCPRAGAHWALVLAVGEAADQMGAVWAGGSGGASASASHALNPQSLPGREGVSHPDNPSLHEPSAEKPHACHPHARAEPRAVLTGITGFSVPQGGGLSCLGLLGSGWGQ